MVARAHIENSQKIEEPVDSPYVVEHGGDVAMDTDRHLNGG